MLEVAPLVEVGSSREHLPFRMRLTGDVIAISDLGFPSGVEIKVTDEAGKSVRLRVRHSELGVPLMGPDMHKLEKGESVSIDYDLREHFEIEKPGRYHVSLSWHAAPLKEWDVEIVAVKQQGTFVFADAPPPRSTGIFFLPAEPSWVVRWSSTWEGSARGGVYTLLTIPSYTYGVGQKMEVEKIHLTYSVERDVEVSDAYLDFKRSSGRC